MISYTSFSFFLLYFGITFIVYSLLPQRIRWVALLLGSSVFYFIAAKGHVVLLLATVLTVWLMGLWLQKLSGIAQSARKLADSKEKKREIKQRYNKYKRLVMALGIVTVVAMLLTCKYTNFFIESFNFLFSSAVKPLDIVQPLGISFFSLQAISYLADIYFGRVEAEKNPLRITLYLSFMLTVVEGPVARYGQLGTQLKTCRYQSMEDISTGFLRVLWGLFKKVVIADRAAVLVNAVFTDQEQFDGAAVALGILFYTLQLYCEFSGIMDVMCGLGRMLGIEMPENFKRPFFAKSINEFWQRWHITLGTWLRDYIFYGISFSRMTKSFSGKTRQWFSAYYANLVPTAVALFFVWLGNGFWHGAGWKYIVYGMYYYVLMMIGLFLEPLFEKLCKRMHIDRQSKGFGVVQIIRTFIIVNFGMLIFRADDLAVAWRMFASLFTNFDVTVVALPRYNSFNLPPADYVVLGVCVAALIAVSCLQERGIDLKQKLFRLPYPAKVPIYLAFVFVIIIFGAYGEGYGVVDLIYANF